MINKQSAARRSAFLLVAGATAIAVAASLAGCGRKADKDIAKITIVGSSTIAPLMSEIAKAFEKKNPGVRIDVQSGGTSRGVLDVRQGTAQIGMVSRALKADEQSELRRVLLALDGLSLIVHKSNPVKSLSKDQVVGIYSGKITNWRDVGGPDLPINVVSKAEGRSTLEIFSHYFGLPYKDIKAHVVIGDNQQGIQTVSGVPAGIGYVSIGTAEYEAGHGAAIRLVPLDGHVPSTAAVAQGGYPLSRELNLVFKADNEAQLDGLLKFAKTPEAAQLATKQFFVPAAR
ncbi:phosphate ABC transporter substrate-binding protein [Roseateles sp. LKC17W]|uniref:Phosphate ABC transporter substrate-binding protein n=1 Tax=Pelomonas margarita TaxID=3299031 RepID=A0ABW7FDM4_9BURK